MEEVPPGARGPDPSRVREALERVLASEGFAASPQLRAFLAFVVTRTIEGRAAEIKGYTVATEALGRPASFDPASDPIVRVEAGRLRKALARYYEAEGRGELLRIVLPAKGYVPHFEEIAVPAPARSRPRASRHPLLAALVALLVVIAGAGLAWRSGWLGSAPEPRVAPSRRPPLVLVLPFRSETASPEAVAAAAGYATELAGALARFPELRVTGIETGLAAAKMNLDDRELGRRFGAQYVLSGTFDTGPEGLVVQAILSRTADGQVLWSERMTGSLSTQAAHGAGRRIVQEIALKVGQPYGIIQAEETGRLLPDAGAWSSYACLLRTFDYWRTYTPQAHLVARDCLERAVQADPMFADALWALAYMRLDEHRLAYNVRPGSDPLAEAQELARRATELRPGNPRAFQALAAVHFVKGNVAGFREAAAAALRLGPYDPDLLADIGSSEVALGDTQAGREKLDDALRYNPVPPTWVLAWRTAAALAAGDTQEALAFARQITGDSYTFGRLVQLAAAYRGGDERLAREAHAVLARTAPEVLADPAAFLLRQGPSGDKADRLVATVSAADRALSQAGPPAGVLQNK